jgi:hypothetical protein
MKTNLSVISILLIICVILMGTASPVSALPGSNWATGIKIQNLSATTDGSIVIKLYSASGSLATTISTTSSGAPLTAPKSSSVEVYLPSYASVPNSQYSAEISSNVPLGVVATMTNYSYGIADSYNSMEPSTEISIPYVYHNHNKWSTEIYVQNTTNSTINGQVILTEPAGGASSSDGLGNKTVNYSIPPYGTYSLNTSDSTHNDLGWFIGAARLTASSPVSIVANQVRLVGAGDVKGNVLIQSRGLTSIDAGNEVVIPSLYKNFSGVNGTWTSGIKLVNPTSSTINAVVTFTADPDRPAYSGTKSLSIPANGNAELYLPSLILDNNSNIPNMFKGYAKVDVVESTGTVVGTVQHTNYLAADGYGVALGYTGFSGGHSQVSLPSLYRWPSGAGIWISGIKVQNTGQDPVTITINLKTDPDVSTWTGSKSNIILDPGEAYELYLGTNKNLDGGLSIPQPWKGSALITATGTGEVSIVATVLHTNYGRHVANMYTGIGIE